MTRPYLHPNGFIHLNLTPNKRLHIWHPQIPQAQKVYTPIHDHTFYFQSRILTGVLTHTTYGVFALDEDSEVYTHRHYAVDTRQEILVPTDHWAEVVKIHEEHHVAGDYYDFGGVGAFHSSESFYHGMTATIMTVKERDHNFPRAKANVLVPRGVEPDNEFRRDGYDVDALMPFVKEAFGHFSTNIWAEVYRD